MHSKQRFGIKQRVKKVSDSHKFSYPSTAKNKFLTKLQIFSFLCFQSAALFMHKFFNQFVSQKILHNDANQILNTFV